jgi:hypothetical protein
LLERTFVHIPGVGAHTERALWNSGCHTWSDLLGGLDRYSCGTADRREVVDHLERSASALSEGRYQYFAPKLGMSEAWRAWPDFRDRCVYLDIETDGGRSGSAVTTIGLYDGNGFQGLVRDIDLGNFPDIISQYSMIVTFFGAGFDLPMLQKRFPSLRYDQIHLDLCPTLRRLGLKGGLKSIEKQLGLARGEDTDGLTGLDAIRLWRQYQRGSTKALETLIAYNREDVVNLETLAEYAYKRLKAASFDAATSVSARI